MELRMDTEMPAPLPTASSTGAMRRGRRRSSVMIEYYRDNYMKTVDKVGCYILLFYTLQ